MANELNSEKKTLAVSMLAEGSSIRSIERTTGVPKAKRAYAWSHLDGEKDQRTRFVAVLEVPSVESAETAVRVQIVKDAKGMK